MKRSEMKKRPSLNSRGSTIIEAVISMLLICLILFGLLQFFYYAAAQMVTDYAAFRAARSETVGFDDIRVSMEGRLKALIQQFISRMMDNRLTAEDAGMQKN